jgi:mannosyltransferase
VACVKKVRSAGGAVAVGLPAAVMLGLGLWGIDRGGMWRDEAVTSQVARRSVAQIWRLLHGVDAVHGLYYLLMHAFLAVRPGEVALRLPSVCAGAATAGLVAAIGVRLARPRVGLWAGLLYAATPMAGHYAQEGRSYALVAAGAAGATLLLLRAVEGRSWWPYGGVVAVTCLLHELAVLVLLAHVVTLALARVPGRVWRGWGCAAGSAVLMLTPLGAVSRGQAGQVAWLAVPGVGSAERLLWEFMGPSGAVFWPYAGLAGVALLWPWDRRRLSLMSVALPWLVVPPLLLMAVSRVWPLYDDRYVLYALPGAPLLAAAGVDRVAGAVGRLLSGKAGVSGRGWLPTSLIGTLAIALSFAYQLPLLRQDRSPAHRPDDLAAVSGLAAREIRSGDPVLFLPAIGRARRWRIPGSSAGCGTWRSGCPGRSPGPCTAVRSASRCCGAGSRRWTGCGCSPSPTPWARPGPRAARPSSSNSPWWARSSCPGRSSCAGV